MRTPESVGRDLLAGYYRAHRAARMVTGSEVTPRTQWLKRISRWYAETAAAAAWLEDHLDRTNEEVEGRHCLAKINGRGQLFVSRVPHAVRAWERRRREASRAA